MNLKDKKALVYDRGLFLHIAQRLGRDFGKVYYYLAEEDPNPKKSVSQIGEGFEEIEVVHDFWEYVDKVDIIVFPDVHNGGLAEWLVSKGYKVFGALASEEIEMDKIYLKKVLKAAGLPVIPFVIKKDLSEIEAYLKDKTDKWLKVPHYRSDLETHHFENAFLAQPWFDDLRKELGPSACKDFEMIIEDAIESDCEAGFEAPMLNGEIPKYVQVGYEYKDKAYAGCIVKELPKYLSRVHDKMKPIFKKFGYQAWYSSELKIGKDKRPYYLDCTARFGCPPAGNYSENYKTFSQNVWDLAHGVMPRLVPQYKYGVELIFWSDFAKKHTLAIEFPEEESRWLKLKDAVKVGKGQYNIIPHDNAGYFGTIAALDNNLNTAIETCLERAKMLRGEEIEYDKNGFNKVLESIEAGKKYGITF